MNFNQLKIRKIFTSTGLFSLILLGNNVTVLSSDLLDNKVILKEKFLKDKEIFSDVSSNKNNKENLGRIFIVDNSENIDEDSNVLISEIVIKGWEDHPEGRKCSD